MKQKNPKFYIPNSKFLLVSCFLFLVAFDALAQISVQNPLGPTGPTQINDLIVNLGNFLIQLLYPLAAIGAMYAAFLFLTSAGNPAKVTQAKKIIAITIAGTAIAIVGGNMNQIITSFVPTIPTSTSDVVNILNGFANFLALLIVPLSAFAIIIGALMIILAGGNPAQIQKAKLVIAWAIVGIVVALAAPAITTIVGYYVPATTVAQGDLIGIVNTIADTLMYTTFVITILGVFWAAFLFMTAAGNEQKIQRGKSLLMWSLIAMVLVSLAKSIVIIVGSYFA